MRFNCVVELSQFRAFVLYSMNLDSISIGPLMDYIKSMHFLSIVRVTLFNFVLKVFLEFPFYSPSLRVDWIFSNILVRI